MSHTTPYTLTCPQCHSRTPLQPHYVGLDSVCRMCGWQRPPITSAVRVLADLDLPILAPPLLVGEWLLYGLGDKTDAQGGVFALHLASGKQWRYSIPAAVPGGVSLLNSGASPKAVFGDAGGTLHVMTLPDPRAPNSQFTSVQRIGLEGGVFHAPLVIDDRTVLLGTQSGLLYRIDPLSGRVSKQTRLTGIAEAAPAYDPLRKLALFVLRQRDESSVLYTFDSAGVAFEWLTLDTVVYGSPMLYNAENLILLGTQSEGVCAYDWRPNAANPPRRWRYPIQQNKPVRAQMTLDASARRLYVADQARQWHVIDPSSGQKQQTGTSSRSPVAFTPLGLSGDEQATWRGLAALAENIGTLSLLDLSQAQPSPVWQFDCSADKRLLDSPLPAAVIGGASAYGQEVVFAALNGRVYAMPYHGGNWGWAAQHAEAQGDFASVAYFKLQAEGAIAPAELAVARYLADRQQHLAAAVLYLHLNRRTDAASQFEHHARATRLPVWWDRAREVWQRIPDEARAQACAAEAAKLGKRPVLKLTVIEAAALQVGRDAKIKVQLHNESAFLAREVHIELQFEDGTHDQHTRAELGAGATWTVSLNTSPSKAGAKQATLSWLCTDELGNRMPTQFVRTDLVVAEPHAPPIVYQIDKMFTGPAHIREIQIKDSVVQRSQIGADG
ncbi:MAG: PQQ-like beta-propeller repeat protein [Anaerolineae bacterium]|nr:PQQ-like beta-propeller repeat protein [Anaerolineae bacterium]